MPKLRLTRRTYKRNIIVFGLMLFMGIALISTGFATWVLSQDTSFESGGNVEVGVVSDNALQISDLKYYYKYDPTDPENEEKNVEVQPNELTFKFEPTEDDVSGRVKNDGENFEQMVLFIVGKVEPMNFIDDFNITMTFDLPEQLEAAVNAKYIELPAYTAKDEDGVVVGVNIIEDGEIKDNATINADGTFVIKIAFAWGEYFNYMNPGKYYDEDPTGQAASYEEVKTSLQNLRNYVYNATYDEEGNEVIGQIPSFTIKITVTAQ